MKKSLYLILLVVIVATLGSCKKSCNFPKYLDGKYCSDIRESLIGNYAGTMYSIYGTRYQPDQNLSLDVREGTGDFTNLVIYQLGCNVNAQDSITFPYQFQTFGQPSVPYHAYGTGSFGDTVLNGKPNKSITFYLTFVNDSTLDTSYNYFFGLR